MADIPGILIFGGVNVQGGAAGNAPASEVTAADVFAGLDRFERQLFRIIPDDGDGEPTADTLGWWPWYDENLGTIYAISGATPTTVTVSPDPGWTTDEWAGFKVCNANAFPGFGFQNKQKTILSNTSNTLTVASWTATPTVGTALWLNEGGYSDYAAFTAFRSSGEILAAIPATRGGGAIVQGGVGIGWDAGLVRELWEKVFTVDPHFVAAKYVNTADASLYAAPGAQRTSFETWLARCEAAFALKYPDDVLVWRYVFLDHVHEDVSGWLAEFPTVTKLLAYESNLTAEIAWLQSTMTEGNSLRVMLANHDRELRRVDASAVFGASVAPMETVATVHRAITSADAQVRAIDFDGADLPTRGDASTAIGEGRDQEYYDSHVYFHAGPKLISRAIELWEAGDALTEADGVMPVYVLLGDSIEVAAVSATYTSELGSATLTATARDTRQRIWNRNNQAIEAYNAHDNSQTSGSTALSGLAGADFSLTYELMRRHPVTGFVLIKRASASSSLAEEASAYDGNENGGTWVKSTVGEHYDELTSDITNCFAAINIGLGMQAELRGIFVGLGSNDAHVEGGGATFAAALPQFVANLRNDFGTVVAGKATPVIWRMPQLGIAGRFADDLRAIRAALVARAAADGQFVALNVDHLERGTDNLHETPASNIARGILFAQALDAVALPNC